MEDGEGLLVVTPFRSAQDSLSAIDAEAAARLITAAADVALVLDENGVIRDLAFDSEELDFEAASTWPGKPWIDTVTIESRPKVQELLAGAAAGGGSAWRQVNHPSGGASDVPILYAVADMGGGKLVAIGRDVRAIAEMQQRLVDAQLSMERDFARLRHAEARYRLLFRTASDAVMVVDPADGRIQEINAAGAQLLGESAERLAARPFAEYFAGEDRAAAAAWLASAEAGGRGGDREMTLKGGLGKVTLDASLFRQTAGTLLLVRLTPASKDAALRALPLARQQLLQLVDHAPDGLVVTDAGGRIIAANAAFLDLAELVNDNQAIGQSLDRWLGRPGVDLRVLTSNLKDHGSVRLFATTLRGEHGAGSAIELSAITFANGDQRCYGFAIRNVDARLPTTSTRPRSLPRSVDQVAELVGRVPLKELVREATDVIEKLCIEAALELTGDNRASAAEMLGLSRQSLYVKLRRYGMADVIADNGGH